MATWGPAHFAFDLAPVCLHVDRGDLVPGDDNQSAVAERAVSHLPVSGLRKAVFEIDDVLIRPGLAYLVHGLDPVTRPVAFFDIAGQFNVPRSPQGRPVIFQAGDSDEGREFAAASADAIFSRHGTLEAGRAFYADVKGRLAQHGRTPGDLLILPAATFVLGDTDEQAAQIAREVRLQQVSGQTAIKFAEQLWNRDLSGYDPDGPLPEIDPDPGENTISLGRASVRMYRDPVATAREWRARAAAENLSLRELIVEVTGRQSFIGSPATVADAISRLVQADASDGFILVPHITPGGLDEFAATVVPLLQERGEFRAEYEGSTLREHLGLARLPAAR